MSQIGGYLAPDEHAEFKGYAAQFHLKDSSLANLLVVRELRLRRLPTLKERHVSGAAKARSRITAHQSNPQLKQAFDAHARACGISPDQAAAILFRAELAERWLEGSVLTG